VADDAPVALAGAGVTFDAELVFVVELAAGGGRSAALVELLASDFLMGLGASTPAVLEPRPSFCRVVASILPLELRPLAD